jgi:hypothetical protein
MSETELALEAQRTGAKEESTAIECASCGCTIEDPESYGAYWHEDYEGDICDECHREETNTCALCGEDGVMPSDVSRFILAKVELMACCSDARPPGIYMEARRPWMSSGMIGSPHVYASDLRFIAPLPELDTEYEISGTICKSCARPYQAIAARVYLWRSNRPHWQVEKAHTRAALLANLNMLRDLECANVDVGPVWGGNDLSTWKGMRDTYDLPEGLETYHQWVFVDHQGVKVYYAGYRKASSWMTLRPEPQFRCNGHGRHAFSVCSLPNWRKHEAAYRTKVGTSLMEMHQRIGPHACLERWKNEQIRYGVTNPDPLDYYRKSVSLYTLQEAIPEAVTIEAIELGYIRQDGIYDAAGKPLSCR